MSNKVKEYDVIYAAFKAVSDVKDVFLSSRGKNGKKKDFREASVLLTQSASLEESLKEAAMKRMPYKIFSESNTFCDACGSETDAETWIDEHLDEWGFLGTNAFCVKKDYTITIYR